MDPITTDTRTIRPIIKTNRSQDLSTACTPWCSPTMKTVKKLRFTDLPSPELGNNEQGFSVIDITENTSLEKSLNLPESNEGLKNNSSYCCKSVYSVITQAEPKNPEIPLHVSKLCQGNQINHDRLKLFETLETESKESCNFLKELSKKLRYLRFGNECVKTKRNVDKDENLKPERLHEDGLDSDIFHENKNLPNCTSQCRIF